MALSHAFTIDLEDWYHGIELELNEWKGKEQRLRKGLDPLLQLLDDTNTKATFFCLGWIGKHYPDLIRTLHRNGHEIASHSYWHKKVYSQNKAAFEEDVKMCNGVFSDLTGEAVRGFRAPFFSVTRQSLWALEVLKQQGYDYDCSISPIVTWRYGIEGAPENLYYLREVDLWEYGLSTTSFLGKKWAIGGAYFRIFPYFIFKKGFAALQKQQQSGMYYCHPWEYDPEHPYLPQMEWKAKLTHYTGLKKMLPRTRQMLQNFSFTTVAALIGQQQHLKTSRSISLY